MNTPANTTGHARFPEWMRRSIRPPGRSREVTRLLDELKLQTVCRSARCPNQAECFARGTATFMILGKTCTRDCRFCAVAHGRPGPPRADEPDAVAEAAARLGLDHVVITSVTRDDLPDGGAGQFADTIRAVRGRLPEATVEVLVPDFLGDPGAIDTVLDAWPDVFNHNVETVPRLYPAVRPEADYGRSLHVLARAADRKNDGGKSIRTKSGVMVGLGESDGEVRRLFGDLRRVGVDVLTVGQYLAPSGRHAPVARFARPDEYEAWRNAALEMGFSAVAAGPYVRSSYQAETLYRQANS